MHLNRAIPLCSAVGLLFSSCMALPAEYRPPRYSVVPIDGGSGPSGSAGSGPGAGPEKPATVTVVKTLPQKTSFHTVYVTSPPTTERVIETAIVTKTIQVVHISQDAKTTNTNLEEPASTTFPTSTTIPSSASLSTTRPAGIPLQTGSTDTRSSTSIISTQGDGEWHPSSFPSWNGTMSRRGSRNWAQPRQLA